MKTRTIKQGDTFLDYRLFSIEDIGNITEKEGELLIRIREFMDKKRESFPIVVIDYMYTAPKGRGTGEATSLLSQFCKTHFDKIIALSAEPSHMEYEDEEGEKSYQNISKKLNDFYGKRGFKSLNDKISNISKTSMIYKNYPYDILIGK